jgi:hypothetical protein
MAKFITGGQITDAGSYDDDELFKATLNLSTSGNEDGCLVISVAFNWDTDSDPSFNTSGIYATYGSETIVSDIQQHNFGSGGTIRGHVACLLSLANPQPSGTLKIFYTPVIGHGTYIIAGSMKVGYVHLSEVDEGDPNGGTGYETFFEEGSSSFSLAGSSNGLMVSLYSGGSAVDSQGQTEIFNASGGSNVCNLAYKKYLSGNQLITHTYTDVSNIGLVVGLNINDSGGGYPKTINVS